MADLCYPPFLFSVSLFLLTSQVELRGNSPLFPFGVKGPDDEYGLWFSYHLKLPVITYRKPIFIKGEKSRML